ncbi:unnamed protein product [Blepharisma stoltei]|uniref:RING-type E3 ubiquitin transferase n=1 Tax=Blepharisma stoltei TaxID=1481888 RepID=A0AAU9JSU1_9CILI|nr:unnamed protein product [Blepharisma stoltei]
MDRDIQVQHYYCHACKVTSSINSEQLLCPRCGSDFLQIAQVEDLRENFRVGPNPFIFAINRQNDEEYEEENPDENRRQVGIPNALFGRIVQNLSEEQNDMRRRDASRRAFLQVLLELLGDNFNQRREVSQEGIESLTVVDIDSEIAEKECMICTEHFKEEEQATKLPCDHLFHSGCVVPWLQMKNSCPVCKRRVE